MATQSGGTWPVRIATATSSTRSPLKSAVVRTQGWSPVVKGKGDPNVPSPRPSRVTTPSELSSTRSRWPSPFKSAMTNRPAAGNSGKLKGGRAQVTVISETRTTATAESHAVIFSRVMESVSREPWCDDSAPAAPMMKLGFLASGIPEVYPHGDARATRMCTPLLGKPASDPDEREAAGARRARRYNPPTHARTRVSATASSEDRGALVRRGDRPLQRSVDALHSLPVAGDDRHQLRNIACRTPTARDQR